MSPAKRTPYDHLRAADPVLARMLDEHGLPEPRPGAGDFYTALVRAIVGQQVSVAAARSMFARLVDHFGGHPPTPQQILEADEEEMRAAGGLSRAKAAYLVSLAEHIVSGELDLDRLPSLSDEEIVEELTAIKGIGVWTAQMFLLFELRRPDVLATGDLGVRRGAQIAFGMDELPAPAELEALGERWRPYRSSACLLLWHTLHNTPDP